MTQFAFVFPGQGSQTVGMLSEMAANYPVIEETFREASDALGYDPSPDPETQKQIASFFNPYPRNEPARNPR